MESNSPLLDTENSLSELVMKSVVLSFAGVNIVMTSSL